MAKPRALFFGTPEFAIASLHALASVADIVEVFSQPDRPAGRGMRLTAPPVKVAANELGLTVSQPTKIKTPELATHLARLEVDVAVVVAYGRILPMGILDAPRRGCVNVHASLLPRWRGAAPIQHAIMAGDAETGVSLMRLDEGLDTGPVIAMKRTPIDPDETAAELSGRLAVLGGKLVEETLRAYLDGTREPVPQPTDGVTHAPLLEKSDGRIPWIQSARTIHDRVRGLHPWPGAWTTLGSARVKVHRTKVTSHESTGRAPGTVLRVDRHGLEVETGAGSIALLELQLEGKRALGYAEFAAGCHLEPGTTFE